MKLKIRELTIFSMLGTLMYISKIVMEALPNIHLLGTFTVAFTVVYRWKALYPIYIYVLLNGVFAGFSMWWMPYLYIWTILWGIVMLLPKRMPKTVQVIVYAAVNALHGYAFGIMYAPANAIMYNLNFEKTVAWVVAGLPFDIMHGTGNVVCGFLIVPIVMILRKMEQSTKVV